MAIIYNIRGIWQKVDPFLEPKFCWIYILSHHNLEKKPIRCKILNISQFIVELIDLNVKSSIHLIVTVDGYCRLFLNTQRCILFVKCTRFFGTVKTVYLLFKGIDACCLFLLREIDVVLIGTIYESAFFASLIHRTFL